MSENSEGFTLPSQKELAENQGGFAPLVADDYIVKLASVRLVKEPTWVNGFFDHSKLKPGFEVIVLPYKLKSGDQMVDSEGKEVPPLTRWIFRAVNPFSTGFNKQGEPSFLRAILCHALNQPISEQLKPPAFILYDPEGNVVEDEVQRQAFVDETNNPAVHKDPQFSMVAKGFKGVADIGPLQGKYIGASVALNKDKNVVSKFSKLPDSFQVDPAVEAEATPKFQERFEKFKAKKDARDAAQRADANGQDPNSPPPAEPETEEEIVIEDSPL